MKKRYILNASATLIILLSTFNFTMVQAQTIGSKKDHLGFAVSFGTRLNKISSDHSSIDGMSLAEGGGSLGLVWGKDMVEANVMLGYYYSASRVPHTVDLVTLETSLRFYPLKAFSARVHKLVPYLTTGLSVNNYKLYGYYAGDESQSPNYSVSLEPYLGNMTGYYGSIGIGFEINFLDQRDFVKFFSDVNYQGVLFQNASELFNNTNVSNQLSINAGLSFGLNRFYK